MSNLSAARNRVDLKPFLSPSALSPRQKPINALWLGDMSSTLSAIAPGRESSISKDLGKPSRLTMFRLFNYMQTSFPRHIPWTMFPVVSDPWFEFKPVQSRWGRERADIYPDPGESIVEVSEILERYDAYVLDAEDYHYGELGLNESLLKLAYTVHHLGTVGKPVYLKSSAFPEARDGDEDERYRHRLVAASDIMGWVRPYAMFMYSYRLNFASIAMKALRAARFGCEKPSIVDHYREMRHRDSHDRRGEAPRVRVNHRSDSNHYWLIFGHVERSWERYEAGLVPQGLDHPLALQLLYALRRAGGTISAEKFLNCWDGGAHMFGELMKSREHQNIQDMWGGTGKYEPICFGEDKKPEQALLATGLVEIDHQTLTLSITDIGERFLNYLHASCEDPDVILRWMNPETRFFNPGSEAAVEEWLTKFFRKMKTRVNLIPPNLCEQRTRGLVVDKLVDEDWD
jgi:hypothetical protein